MEFAIFLIMAACGFLVWYKWPDIRDFLDSCFDPKFPI